MFFKTCFEIESNLSINSSKEEIALSRDSKELFVQLFVWVFDQNRKHGDPRDQKIDTPSDFTVLW